MSIALQLSRWFEPKTTPAVIGLDLGRHCVKAVVRRRRRVDEIVAAGSLEIAAEMYDDRRALARVVGPWLRELSHGAGDVVASPPSHWIDYESVEAPRMLDGERDAFVQSTIANVLGAEADRASFDCWWFRDEPNSAGMFHLAWTSADFAEQLSNELSRYGFQCAAIDAPVAALSRLGGESGGSTLIVDLSDEFATFIWRRRGETAFFRNQIRFATRSAVDELAMANEVTWRAAGELLARWGFRNDENDAECDPIVRVVDEQAGEWAKKLAHEIDRTTGYLDLRFSESVDRIELAGGGARVNRLDRRLAQLTGIPSYPAALPTGWQWRAAERYSPAYAQAVALTMHGDAA